MSLFRVNVVARNPRDERLETAAVVAVVDTGSELTWLPGDLLMQVGITPRRKRTSLTATRQMVTREVGYAILSSEGFETTDDVVFAEPGDLTLLGVRTLEGFGVVVDNVGHRFVAQSSIVAAARPARTVRVMLGGLRAGAPRQRGAQKSWETEPAQPAYEERAGLSQPHSSARRQFS